MRKIRKRKISFAAAIALSIALLLHAGATANAQSATQQPNGAPHCDVKGDIEITITCDYAASPTNGAESAPLYAIDHASFSFDTNEDSHMKIGLTFTNRGSATISGGHTVYISIDGAAGKNYMRRPLPHVDLSKIAPNQTVDFSETLLSPAFPRGTYTIHLWIPSPIASLKFNPAHNVLLSNTDVPDSATGLNTLATFTVTTLSGRQKHVN